ncbi:hypothetical protein HSBAA_23270 [Vreelandella sulfidaeris]|uniref:Pyrrolo-quinoline quinone repeat domain-containing protein n=1 Tax=Vreelandella sulfidaeris TaxID=115553 RepID=A0A455U932_9GAMM|nr:hypothetical protein HSBAA_23270 [Halomonas sulfidaeris]
MVGDRLILGWAGMDWAYEQTPPGTVFSINARTGEREWTFQALSDEVREQSGTANVWTHMSADEELGLVYLPVSSPSPNFWGGNRTEEVPLATSTTALDIETGEVVWSRQWVHHDIWDYDINAAPTLMDITVDGEEIPALIQATKMGFCLSLTVKPAKTCGRLRSVRYRKGMVILKVRFMPLPSLSQPSRHHCLISQKNLRFGR